MFGIVPKVLWDKRTKPDGLNRINLALRPLLIQTKDNNILVDTGMGDKYSQKEIDIYDVRRTPGLLASLGQAGLSPEDIHYVVLTHLHFDHCGGNTIRHANGKIMPTFPNARYIIQRGEWEAAIAPNERTKSSYRSENLLPLQEHGVLQLIEGDFELVPGVNLVVTGGHTRCHQIVIVKPQDVSKESQEKGKKREELSKTEFFKDGEHSTVSGVRAVTISSGKCAVYWGDLIPTTAHIDLPYIMGYDLYPEETLARKKMLLEQVVSNGWLCFWEHDPDISSAYIKFDGARYSAEPAEGRCKL